jgi:hypothetical protein
MDTKKIVKMTPTVWKFAFLNGNKTTPFLWGWHQARELLEVINNTLADLGKESMTTEDLLREYPFITPYFDGESSGNYWSVDSDGLLWNTVSGAHGNWLELMVIKNSFLPAGIGALFIEAVKDPIGSLEKKLNWMKRHK